MRIHIASLAKDVQAEPGENLYRVVAKAGLLDAPCGGQGRCGKCGLRFVTPPPPVRAREQELFSAAALRAGWRLSCLHSCDSDMELELPLPGGTAVDAAAFEFSQAAQLPLEVAEGWGLAVDLGTTTLAAALFDRKSGGQLAAAARLNSQKIYGQDVISRVHYARDAAALRELQNALITDIELLLKELCPLAGARPEQVTFAACAGNPAMIHLLAGVDPTPLGQAPYRLALSGAVDLCAAELGLKLAPGARLYCLPAVAAYLGGDVVGGLLALGLDASSPATKLLVDIGTNGEMALVHEGKIMACSTAAGPALEGMNIRCGMRAAPGAVDEVEIAGAEVRYSTIGHEAPRGLAGSGLLSAISALVRAGLLDGGGRLRLAAPLTEEAGQRQLVIDAAAGIVLTQEDIRQVQLAKGAIRAGLETLLCEAACPIEALDEVLVAGSFGAHLSPQSLLTTGLMPPGCAGKIHYVGNASLSGARLCLLSRQARQKAEQLAGSIHYIELARQAGFQQRFMQAMRFEV